MVVKIGNETISLKDKQREIGSEAPAIRVKMLDGGVKVIGMMADKVQVIITLPTLEGLSNLIIEIMEKYNHQANIYLIGADDYIADKKLDKSMISSDFEKLTKKFGVNINNKICAKSVFIINKDGEIVYKEVLSDLDADLKFSLLEDNLLEAINFKKKGHVHEDWMSA